MVEAAKTFGENTGSRQEARMCQQLSILIWQSRQDASDHRSIAQRPPISRRRL